MSSSGGSGVGSDFVYFLGIIIVIFAIWVASGGPERPISFAGPFLRPITTTATTAQPYGDPNQFHSIQGTSWIPTLGGSSNTNVSGDYSEYRGAISLSRDTAGARSTKADTEYITIQTSYGLTSPVSLTGWKLVSSETGINATVPQGAELLRSGKVNTLSNITLRQGDQLIVSSGRSPVGVSFKENMCTGYLGERQPFTPSMYLSCPSLSGDYARFEDSDDYECMNYLRSFNACSTKPSYDSGNPSSSCEDFADEYGNYNGCVKAHENDSDFLSSVWRVYLGQKNDLWKNERETILLLDASGKTVDAISY